MQVTNLLFSLLVAGAAAKKCTHSLFCTDSLFCSDSLFHSAAIFCSDSYLCADPHCRDSYDYRRFYYFATLYHCRGDPKHHRGPILYLLYFHLGRRYPQSTLLSKVSSAPSSESSPATVVIVASASEAATTTSEAAATTTTTTTTADTKSSASNDNLTDDQTNALNAINAARADVGTSALTWDEELVASAQQWANYLTTLGKLEHSGSGENLFWASGSSTPLVDAINSWNSEKSNYKGGSVSKGNVASIGHYTQNIWKSTTKFGIASAIDSKGGVYVVAHYDPVGNFLGQAPY
uniref:SCP domain-containing protein n=1 Tax=Bionectria ochroleuca TaxID=29856 RepID=A0A8H7NBH2_BIOOC